MELIDYKNIIQNMPVRKQSFITKRKTWTYAEDKLPWLLKLNNNLFKNNLDINISREDIFNSQSEIRELILKTIYWGYSSGMRGNNFIKIMENIESLEDALINSKITPNKGSDYFIKLTEKIKEIPGIHLSTYSKLLYFLEITFNKNPCFILDQRLIAVFANSKFKDYAEFEKINYNNAESRYLEYIATTNKLAIDMETKGENIEQFLFTFGNNLKE